MIKNERVLRPKKGVKLEMYKAELLDQYGTYKGDLFFRSASIQSNADYDVKKSATLELYDIAAIDKLSDRVALYMSEGGTYEKLGEFIIIGLDGFKLSLADESIILQQSRPLYKKVFKAGTLYVDALKWFLITSDIIKFNIQHSDMKLKNDIIIDDTKNKIQWFNYIADQINYKNLFVDVDGYFKSYRYIEPNFENVAHIIDTKSDNIVTSKESHIDIWNVPNVIKRTLSRSDRQTLTSIYRNTDPLSRFSIKNRGFEVVDIGTVDSFSTQEELDLYVTRLAIKAMQVDEVLKIQIINTFGIGVYDIIQVDGQLYEVISITIDLNIHSNMTMYLKRAVFLND